MNLKMVLIIVQRVVKLHLNKVYKKSLYLNFYVKTTEDEAFLDFLKYLSH